MLQKWFNRLIGVAGVLFVLLWLTLHFFNRLAADDYQLLYERFHYGIVDATINQYYTWCGRWVPLAFTYTVLSFAKWKGFLFCYGLLTVSFFVLASYRFFWVTAKIYLPEGVPSRRILGVAVFFILTFFFLTPEKNEVWFWFNSTSMYLWNLILVMFGASFLVWDRGKTEYILIVGSFVYVGASSEPFAIATIGILVLVILYQRVVHSMFSFKYLLALLSALMAFIINIMALGNEARQNHLPPASGKVAVHNTCAAVYHMLHDHGLMLAGFAVLFFAIWVTYGMYISRYHKPFKKFQPLYLLLGIVLLKIFWVFILFPTAYTLGAIPPQRVQGPLFFSLAAYVSIFGLYTGISIGSRKLLEYVGFASVIAVLGIMGFLIVKHTRIEPVYARAVLERKALLLLYKADERTSVLYLEPLPDSGYLHTAEITRDTTHFINEQLKAGLELDYNIALKP